MKILKYASIFIGILCVLNVARFYFEEYQFYKTALPANGILVDCISGSFLFHTSPKVKYEFSDQAKDSAHVCYDKYEYDNLQSGSKVELLYNPANSQQVRVQKVFSQSGNAQRDFTAFQGKYPLNMEILFKIFIGFLLIYLPLSKNLFSIQRTSKKTTYTSHPKKNK